MRLDDKQVPWGEGIFRRTKRITLELSNLCNLSAVHARCPASFQTEPVILPETIVLKVLETCKSFSFKSVLAFHMYNEPGVDPRLIYFMDLFKKALPGLKIYLLTNGWYLSQSLAEEYVRHGVDFMDVTTYDTQSAGHLAGISLPIPLRLVSGTLDDRLDWYGRNLQQRWKEACFCPLYDVCIDCRGRVVLCSYDWKRTVIFGDLNTESLESVLQKPDLWSLYDELSSGKRRLEICKGCPMSRGEMYTQACISER